MVDFNRIYFKNHKLMVDTIKKITLTFHENEYNLNNINCW